MTAQELLSIGQVAAATGLTVSAVRYYDEFGLIAAVERAGGKRRFDPGVVGTLRLIRETQRCGFSLDEIRTMLAGSDWRSAVDTKLADLREQRRRIDDVTALLESIRGCECASIPTCAHLADALP